MAVALSTLLLILSICHARSLCVSNCDNGFMPFDNLFFNNALRKPWWKGPNVCDINEDPLEKKSVDEIGNSKSNYTSYQKIKVCHDRGNAYVCKTTTIKNGEENTEVTGKICCPGFERTNLGFGCQKGREVTGLIDTLKQLGLEKLADVFEKASLPQKLANKNVTIFAPTNEALERNDTNGIASVVVVDNGDEMQPVRDILLGTMVDGILNSWNLDTRRAIKTMNHDGGQLLINLNNQGMTERFAVNCATVTKADVPFQNGVVHLVNSVVQPAATSVLNILQTHPRFSKFLSLVPEETQQLLANAQSKVTVFAFTNEAFERLPKLTKEAIESRSKCYKDLIKHHILRTIFCLDATKELGLLESKYGAIFPMKCRLACVTNEARSTTKFVVNDNGQVMLNNAVVVEGDLVAQNGVLHVLDNVSLPIEVESPLENVGLWSQKMKTLLEDSDLLKQVDDTQYSILIPPATTLMEIEKTSDAKLRRDMLARYVVTGEFENSKTMPTSLAKEELNYKSSSPSLCVFQCPPPRGIVNCVKIISDKLTSCGGAVYRLTSPLPPSADNLMELMKKNPKLQQFVMMVEAAGLADSLTNVSFSGTVFAFEDDDFDKTFDGDAKAKLMGDSQRLKKFIGNHIVNGLRCCSDLIPNVFSIFDRHSFQTIVGDSKAVSGIDECCLRYGSSEIAQCNAGTARNGVLHMLKGPDVAAKVMNLWKPFDITFNRQPFDDLFRLF